MTASPPAPLPSEIFDSLCNRTLTACLSEKALQLPPDHLAIVSDRHRWSYQYLESRANGLAEGLLKHCEGAGRFIILLIGQSDMAVLSILAALKAGKVCVPIQPANREARALDQIVTDLSPCLALFDEDGASLAASLSDEVPCINVEDLSSEYPSAGDRGRAAAPDDLAFIIYTSGSTGEPKGVMHSHRNILSRIVHYEHQYGFGPGDRCLMMASLDHISGIMGSFRPLVTGGTAFLFDFRKQGFEGLERILEEENLTVLTLVNSVFRSLMAGLDSGRVFPTVRLLILGSEAMTVGDVDHYRRHFSDDCCLLNTFGSTELPTYRQFLLDKQTELKDDRVPIGHAVAGVEVSIVDDAGACVPVGEMGEIITHSKYMALGYWDRPEETTARFFVDERGLPSCRTGDLGRLSSEGVLEFLGRKDWQVKILGNRVELGEIERVLATHPEVEAAALKVLDTDRESYQLCAFVVQGGSPASESELKAFLRECLPDYMVPAFIETLEALPLTASGKVNRRGLPDPCRKEMEKLTGMGPVSQTEEQITKICQEVLETDKVALNDNLFDLGLESLKVMRIINRLNKQFGIRLPVSTPLTHPSISQLATRVDFLRAK